MHGKMGHLGGERVYQLAKESFYWSGMEKDITDYIRNKCSLVRENPICCHNPLSEQ